jgi:hypothetical protein
MKRKLVIGLLIIALLGVGFIIGNIMEPIRGYSATGKIQTPLNVSVENTGWTAITLGAGQRCSGFVARIRGASNDWKMSDSSTGTKYITIDNASALSMDIDADKGETLFYVQTSTGADTLEVLLNAR